MSACVLPVIIRLVNSGISANFQYSKLLILCMYFAWMYIIAIRVVGVEVNGIGSLIYDRHLC